MIPAERPDMRVLSEVRTERYCQNDRWGEQNHPDFPPQVDSIDWNDGYSDAADGWKLNNASRASNGQLAWDGILLEEVFEALAEGGQDGNPAALRAELIQVAAVATCWAEALDRRAARAVRAADEMAIRTTLGNHIDDRVNRVTR